MNIEDVVKSVGWQEIKVIFEEMVDAEMKAIPLTQPADQIAIQYASNIKAKAIIKRALNKIEKITTNGELKKISYK